MSYLVLARKSRPQTFAEVVGQRPVVKTLQNSLSKNRVAHALLFSGVRGVGKTTLARIMAKAINCTGETETPPCNECPSCKEITAGSALDLFEIDGASNRGIQEIRELKDKIKFLPTSCRYKIIIIDEVHMLTTEAFNALLKTLEEPPAHVHFMFATTELHKIPITILSRCQQYELKRIPAAELTDHFAKLAIAEDVSIDPGALSLIVREAEGSVRDGLSLLDQVFSFGEQHITVEDVTEVLGLVDREILLQLCVSLLEGNRASALSALEDLFTFGMDIKRFSSDLLDCFRTLLLTRIEGCSELIDLPKEELDRYISLAANYSPQTLHQKLTLLMQLVEDIRYSSQPRLTMETGFLKIIESGNIVAVSEILGKLDSLLSNVDIKTTPPPTETKPDIKKKTIDRPEPEPTPTPEPVIEEPPLPEDPPTHTSSATTGPIPTTPEGVASKPEHPAAAPEPEPQSPSQPVEIHSHEKDIRKHWHEFLDYVKSRRVWMAQVLNRADVKNSGSELQLHYDDSAECSVLSRKENKNELTEFVLDFFQKEITVRFVVPEANLENDSNGEQTPHQKRQQLANNPLTIMTAEIFNAQVGDIRIGPRSR